MTTDQQSLGLEMEAAAASGHPNAIGTNWMKNGNIQVSYAQMALLTDKP